MGTDQGQREREANALGKAFASTSASLMRMQAHSLTSIADTMYATADALREQADRVEHGGELPDLRVVEEPEGEVLPRIRMSGEALVTESGEALPDSAARFLATLNAVYTRHGRFVEMWNLVAAGQPASVDAGLRLTAAIRELPT
jgi:hypothetical protein